MYNVTKDFFSVQKNFCGVSWQDKGKRNNEKYREKTVRYKKMELINRGNVLKFMVFSSLNRRTKVTRQG